MKYFNTKEYQKALIDIGIEEKEALIYLSALELGGGTVSQLADVAKIERTGIYYYIDRMMSSGLLKTASLGKRTVYLPTDPDFITKLVEKRQQNITKILPALQQQFSKDSSRSIVEYYQGREEVNLFYDRVYQLLKQNQDQDNINYVLGNSFNAVTSKGQEFLKFTPPVEQINIITKAILPRSQKNKTEEENAKDPYIVTRYNLPKAEIKYLNDKYNYPGSISIMGNKIAFYDFRSYSFSITENANIAATWKMFFQYIWDSL